MDTLTDACGGVHGVDVQIYSAHVCFSEWLGILNPCGQPLFFSQDLGSSDPSIYLSNQVDWPSSLEDSWFCCSKHTPLATHRSRENTVIRPDSDNLNWLYSD